MSEKLTLREKLHIGEKRPDGEKPRMSKKLKKGIIAAACVVGVCGAVWGGLTIARNAQRGDVNVYAVNECAMTDYWGDTSNTSGMVTTDKLQKIYISQSQTVKKVWVKEGDSVKKGTVLVSYDSTLTQATVERAKIDYDRQTENLEVMKNELELLKKAKNKETLQAEYDKLQKELAEEIAKINNHEGYDPNAKITEPGKIGVEGSTGYDKDHPLYYQILSGTKLNDATLNGILQEFGRADPTSNTPEITTYIVLVTRENDKKGGIPSSLGLALTKTFTPDATSVGSEVTTTANKNQSTGQTETPTTPVAGTVSFSFQVCDLDDYVDPGRTYNTEEYKKLQRKIAQIKELLDTSMTQLEINKAILEKAQAVKEQEVNLKVAKLKLDKKLAELGDGNVYAEFDGTVKAVRDPDEAYNNSEAVVELSGGGGYYVTGTLSEMDLGSVQVGDSVSISSWMTGAACEGTIVSIDDYPTSNGNNWGDGNSNVSYYPFKVFVTEDANLQPNDYVDIQYQKDTSAEESGSSLYLQSMFIRTDNGKSYVMARGEDGRLEQRWVQTGRDLWGSYTQIRGGLTIDDYVAFPYGRDVVEGAHTQEATTDQLYNYGI
ncbi:MAG: biotin/lipoyl-binding protein [Clostridiales bacterium]|nr:biotin/lipoyl-binding protein [Clostridiales bacterium]